MLVSQLDWPELNSRLRGAGLKLRTGPFVVQVRSSLTAILEGVAQLYADFPLAGDEEFVEYAVSVQRIGGSLSWMRPRARVVTRGNTSTHFEGFTENLGFAFLEWGLNWSIYGRYSPYIILHAAVLERRGCAVIILGDSGSGKSTLSSALAFSGWRLLSDELGLIDPDDGLITPLARPISLKSESINVIRSFAPQAVMSAPQRTQRKGYLAHVKPPSESVRRMAERARPTWIVLVKYVAGSPLTVSDVPKPRAFAELLRSGFNYRQSGEIGFRECGRLTDSCPCQLVQYGNLADVIAHFDSPLYQPE